MKLDHIPTESRSHGLRILREQGGGGRAAAVFNMVYYISLLWWKDVLPFYFWVLCVFLLLDTHLLYWGQWQWQWKIRTGFMLFIQWCNDLWWFIKWQHYVVLVKKKKTNPCTCRGRNDFSCLWLTKIALNYTWYFSLLKMFVCFWYTACVDTLLQIMIARPGGP